MRWIAVALAMSVTQVRVFEAWDVQMVLTREGTHGVFATRVVVAL